MIFPALLLVVLFSYIPFILTFLNSIHSVSLSGERLGFVGLANYRRIFGNQSFHTSLSNTIRFTLFFVPTNITITLLAAVLSNRKGWLANLNQIFFFLPMAVGMSSMLMIIKMMFNPSIGIINRLVGVNIQWFNDPDAAMALLVIAGVFLGFGFDFLLFSAALRNVPNDLKEVARINGANGFQIFRHLELPLIAPTLVFIIVTNIKNAMLISAPVLILTEGGPFRSTQTLVYQMYLDGFKSGNYALGSAIAIVVFLLTFAALLILLHLERRRIYYQ
ncbi:MAG TPA: sugar ABC transporter permease [Sphaerochaeta sp.]|jgi:sn-glycerol 3-phosphate transport system permease protein|nr:sugar ABC transporter permease [Sphaerochaeta sp.]HQB54483.1 sugar ABC transporter permease [Sphaerochaeta sp.]